MTEFGSFSGKHIEQGEQYNKLAPSFRDIYPDSPHLIARTQVNPKMERMAQVELGLARVNRQWVPDAMVDWSVAMPSYNPPTLDLPRGSTRFAKQGDSPQDSDPSKIETFKSWEVAFIARDKYGFPLNPMGRTGLHGRGMLDKWGPTEAADPILTRHNQTTGQLEVLIIKRGDTGEWALPGGKVDAGETPATTAKRELIEEAGAHGVDLDFSKSSLIYAGYIDDSRNTDNAWMESTALHLHLDNEQSSLIQIMAGSDADAARWAAINDELFQSMLKIHANIIRLAIGQAPRN